MDKNEFEKEFKDHGPCQECGGTWLMEISGPSKTIHFKNIPTHDPNDIISFLVCMNCGSITHFEAQKAEEKT